MQYTAKGGLELMEWGEWDRAVERSWRDGALGNMHLNQVTSFYLPVTSANGKRELISPRSTARGVTDLKEPKSTKENADKKPHKATCKRGVRWHSPQNPRKERLDGEKKCNIKLSSKLSPEVPERTLPFSKHDGIKGCWSAVAKRSEMAAGKPVKVVSNAAKERPVKVPQDLAKVEGDAGVTRSLSNPNGDGEEKDLPQTKTGEGTTISTLEPGTLETSAETIQAEQLTKFGMQGTPLETLLKAMEPELSLVSTSAKEGTHSESTEVDTPGNGGKSLQKHCSGFEETVQARMPLSSHPLPSLSTHSEESQMSIRETISSSALLSMHHQGRMATVSQQSIMSTEEKDSSSQASASSLPQSSSSSSKGGCKQPQVGQPTSEPAGQQKEKKPKKPGRYICSFCNRACAKPSVLEKHIRSHTGERPYPCVTCGFSFKTKSNLYKHMKSHTHALKARLTPSTESVGHASEATMSRADTDTSIQTGESTDTEEEQMSTISGGSEIIGPLEIGRNEPDTERPTYSHSLEGPLPTVVINPARSRQICTENLDFTTSRQEPGSTRKNETHQLVKMKLALAIRSPERKRRDLEQVLQQQQSKSSDLLSPLSKGSTDSGYFSRSESAEFSSPSPYPQSYKEIVLGRSVFTRPTLTTATAPKATTVVAPTTKTSVPIGKTLQEHIDKLISHNEALIDNTELDSVKPRRTSLTHKGSIDSPRPYTFKDSFQFELRPSGSGEQLTSMDIQPGTSSLAEKCKSTLQLLSVPQTLNAPESLLVTRSNSMPAVPGYLSGTGVSLPSCVTRECHSFDERMSASQYDDVFLSDPAFPLTQSHHHPLVRQKAFELSRTVSRVSQLKTLSVDESTQEAGPSGKAPSISKSHSLEHESVKASGIGEAGKRPQRATRGKGLMYECDTCRSRYRKLEKFEAHKKYYCSELHAPRRKASGVPQLRDQPQMMHYKVSYPGTVLKKAHLIRKRRKEKSLGSEEDSITAEEIAKPSTTLVMAQKTTVQVQGPQHSGSMLHVPAQQSIQYMEEEPSTSLETQSITDFTPECASTEQVQGSSLERSASDSTSEQEGGGKISVIQHTKLLGSAPIPEGGEPSESGSGGGGAVTLSQYEATKLNTGRPIASPASPQHQSHKLVRQHNIQVPEILVTEEKDTEEEIRLEIALEETYWPQRSDTLAQLPAEKLPPKKKRLRLTAVASPDICLEPSSSRGYGQDSSLSSQSMSVEQEEAVEIPRVGQMEIIRTTEFLTVPTVSHTMLASGMVHREMQRETSEQLQSELEQSQFFLPDVRSKSFDVSTAALSHHAVQGMRSSHQSHYSHGSSRGVPPVQLAHTVPESQMWPRADAEQRPPAPMHTVLHQAQGTTTPLRQDSLEQQQMQTQPSGQRQASLEQQQLPAYTDVPTIELQLHQPITAFNRCQVQAPQSGRVLLSGPSGIPAQRSSQQNQAMQLLFLLLQHQPCMVLLHLGQ
uniref:zinc finger protein 40-like n=1 Tax=Myxine glutinosa TaxID=7769 RepID=UPI00358FA182